MAVFMFMTHEPYETSKLDQQVWLLMYYPKNFPRPHTQSYVSFPYEAAGALETSLTHRSVN